jgi:glycosyltransferase involved in cell wall biosynthesis
MRLAVVSPFLDRRHGTERVVIEQLERLSALPGLEIHVYAQRLEDLAQAAPFDSSARSQAPGSILWHKVSSLPGPHLFGYIWWFFANQFHRWRDARFRGLSYDLVYSPGINAWDADAIAIHIVFHEFYRQLRPYLRLSAAPLSRWPRLLHRRLYYWLIIALESRIYRDPRTHLSAVSGIVARQLAGHFQRTDVPVISHGVDAEHFSSKVRLERRETARSHFGLTAEEFVLLLIGNDWMKKGLPTLLRAVANCQNGSLKLIVVGTDQRSAFEALIRQLSLTERVFFHPPSNDVLQFYAAADAYAGPSLEDAYGLPFLEAMACGLPVIASVRAGVSEIMRDGVDGFLLRDPEDHMELAGRIRQLAGDPALRERMGTAAALTAQQHTWDRNAAETWQFLKDAAARKQDARRRQEAR